MRAVIICGLMALALAACSSYGSNSGSSSAQDNGPLGPAGTTDNINAPNNAPPAPATSTAPSR